ncbi:MAG: hypothetical protein IPM45_15610 [Acidimicrobiales bacterium]|nr:hypothetical protein [Acidimicrobiales bacterium]
MTAAKPPEGLGKAGTAMWRAVTGSFSLEAHERLLLATACRQADLCAQLELVLEADGLVVAGASGQARLNGAVAELRQCRLALGKLLAELRLPGEDGRQLSPAQLRGRAAAEARWGRTPARGGRRGG